MARIKETLVMLVCLATSVLGLAWVFIAWFANDSHHNQQTLTGMPLLTFYSMLFLHLLI